MLNYYAKLLTFDATGEKSIIGAIGKGIRLPGAVHAWLKNFCSLEVFTPTGKVELPF